MQNFQVSVAVLGGVGDCGGGDKYSLCSSGNGTLLVSIVFLILYYVSSDTVPVDELCFIVVRNGDTYHFIISMSNFRVSFAKVAALLKRRKLYNTSCRFAYSSILLV